MSTRVAIIHTTHLTIEPLRALIEEAMAGAEIVNIVDDSILPQLRRNGGSLDEVESRLVHYARVAEEVGASAVLSACSSVGPLAVALSEAVSIPVVRIDEAMAYRAVETASRIGVAATLSTTLRPTLDLLGDVARAIGREVELVPCLVDAAFDRLVQGDREGHDELLAERLRELVADVEVVVLAQASMARVLDRLPDELRRSFLTSPRLAVERLAQAARP